MKKLLVLLALCMVLSVVLVACTEDTPTDETTDVTTEAPGTDAPTEGTTEAPTTDAGTTEAPTTEAPTTEAPTTEEPTTEEPVPDPDPVITHLSFDELDKWIDISGDITNSANSLGSIFTPGQSAGWDKIATVDDYTIAYLRVWGWVGFFAEEVGEFGYQIDDQEPVFSADFAVVAGQDVVQAAAGTGAKCASRMTIMIPVRDLSGEHTIKALVKDAAGTIEELTVFTLNKAVDPDAPTFMIDVNTINSIAPGSPDVANVALSEDGSYVTLTNGTVGDPYVTFRQINANARYVAIKYRTNVSASAFNLFAASTGNDATGAGDMLAPQNYVADGMWHVAIVDTDPAEAVNEECALSFVRYDFFTDGQDRSIDVAYIAGFNSAEAAEAYFAKTMLVADNTNTFASDVNANEVGTDLGASDLANFFTLNLPTGGHLVEAYGEGKVYSMDNINEMLADVNGAYYVSVNILSGAVPSSVFVRGYHVVNSDAIIEAFDPAAGIFKINNYYETDGGTWCGGAGIYATITNGNLFIVLKAYDANATTRVSNPAWMIPCEGTTLTIADNGYTVSLMVDGVTYATIDLIGAQSYADINDVSPAGQFAAKAIVTLKDGTTQTIENTLVAATVNSQVGVVARAGGTKFDSIVVGGYSAIEVPALEIVEPEPVDPNAPIFVATPEILANATTTGNQSTAVISDDGKFVTITAGEGNPVDANFWVVSPGSMITGVKYVGLKYRTTVNPGGEFFVGSANITGGADELKFEYVADGEWQVLILDITSFVNADGLVNYMRFDYFMAASVGCSIDIENIALFKSLEDAELYYGLREPAPEEPAPFEGKWHASVDSFMYCVNDDFSDVVTFAGANTNSVIGTTITSGSGTLPTVTAKYVYFAGGWLAVDGYSLENWVCNIYAADGTLLNTIELGLKVAEEGVLTHVANNMGYTGVPNRCGNDTEIINLGEYAGQTVTVVYAVDLVDSDYTVELIKIDVNVPAAAPANPNGTLEAPLTVSQTLAAVAGLEAGSATADKYFTTGVVTEIGQGGSYYKNVYFTDGEQTMLIYTLNPMDGMGELKVGDTITVNGYIKNYNGTIEYASNGGEYVYIVAYTAA